MDAPGLSIFFPCYNDAPTIGALVAQAGAVAAARGLVYEIIVVDDGSRDDSPDLLRRLAEQQPRLRPVFHERNLGYGAALRSGFRHATREWVFYTDGDGQYDASELDALLSLAGDGVDAVLGYKISRSDPAYRVLIGGAYLRAMRLLFGLRVRDLSCDFRLLRRSLLTAGGLACDSGAICVELMLQLQRAGARTVDCPVHHYARPHGASEFFRPRHVAAMLVELAGLWRKHASR